MSLNENTRLLDLGGGNGSHLHMCLQGTAVKPENVTIADLRKSVFDARRFGYRAAQLQPGPLPFADDTFDVVFCSSVIEHLVPQEGIWSLTDESWARRSIIAQRAFADEIRRVGKGYWVQTPARSFLFETHSWLPFVGWLPRKLQVAILKVTRKFWISKHAPDFYLLTRGHMEALFPEAKIVAERSLGMTKSWIAAKVAH